MEGRGQISCGGAPDSLYLAVLHDTSSRKKPPRKPEHSGEGSEADGEVDAGDPAQPPDINLGRELVDVGPGCGAKLLGVRLGLFPIDARCLERAGRFKRVEGG